MKGPGVWFWIDVKMCLSFFATVISKSWFYIFTCNGNELSNYDYSKTDLGITPICFVEKRWTTRELHGNVMKNYIYHWETSRMPSWLTYLAAPEGRAVRYDTGHCHRLRFVIIRVTVYYHVAILKLSQHLTVEW